jgi:flagellar motor switch protein FliM
MYEQERVILEAADAEGRDLTDDESKTLSQIYAKARPLYDHAWAKSMGAARKVDAPSMPKPEAATV